MESPRNSTRRRLTLRRLFVIIGLLLAPELATGQNRALDPRRIPKGQLADSVHVYLMTMGQGDDLYELFGHNAIWVHDPSRAVDSVYNWGVFSFEQPHFIWRFLQGRNDYYMMPFRLDETMAEYRQHNREVWAQELNLTEAEKQKLIEFVHWNALPQNSAYRYNYYLDNCSTRVRDALDLATGGQIRPQLKAIRTEETYRSHSLRLMQGMPAIVSGVELLLGEKADVKLSADEASFLPVQLMNYLTPLKLDGGARPLFKNSFVVNQATRDPEPAAQPPLWLWFLPVSLVLSGLIAWLGVSAVHGRRQRLAAFFFAFIAGVIGVLGVIIVFLVGFTDHSAAHRNENVFMLNPLWLVVALIAPAMMLRPVVRRYLSRLIQTCGALGLLAVVLHLIGMGRQANWDAILLVLPVELALVLALTWPRKADQPAV